MAAYHTEYAESRYSHHSSSFPHVDPYEPTQQPKHELSYPNLYLASMAPEGRRDSMTDVLREGPDGFVQDADPKAISATRRTVMMILLLIGLLFSVMDTTIVSTALVSITTDLGHFQDVYWVVLAYMLSYLGLCVGIAKLADHFGRQAMVISSWVVFIAFSVACGCSKTMTQLIAFRALQGVGGSGLYSLCQIVIAEIAAPGQNALVSMLVGMTLAISFVLGPILGGALSLVGWHWIFYINIPFGAISLGGLVLIWPSGFGKSRTAWGQFHKIDYLGNLFLILACVFLVFSLQQAGSMTVSWSSATFIVLFVLSWAFWVLLCCWQVLLRYKNSFIEPIFPVRLAQNRVYVAALVTIFLTGFSYMAIVITLPERFQIVNADSTIMAGVHLLPMLGATAVGSIVGGAISKTKNNTSYTLVLASACQLVGIGLLTTFKAWATSVRPQYGYQTIFGFGVGMSFSAATILTRLQSSDDDHAVAQGAIAQVRVLGGAIGVVMCTIVFNSHVQNDLHGSLQPEDLNNLYHAPLATLDLPKWEQSLVKTTYAKAFNAEVWIMLYVACVAFVASIFTFERRPTPLEPASDSGSQSQGRAVDDKHRKNLSSRGGSSDTELEDLGSDRSDAGPSAPPLPAVPKHARDVRSS